MAKQTIKIDNIWGGWQAAQYFHAPGQYLHSVGIDPFLPISDSVGDRLSSGVLRPTPTQAFSGAAVDDNVNWLITNPKNTLIYAILNNGSIISYSSSFGSETDIGAITGAKGNGAVYYNNYIYVAGTTNVSRYGPLDGAAAIGNTFWTGTLSQTALVNTTYPSIRGSGTMPNHVMHVHNDDQLYFADFDSTSSTDTTRGKGLIHAIKTKYGSAEGDTDDGSAYNVLDLPLGYMPTCLASFGTDLVIGAIQGSDGTVGQGKAALFVWDTVDVDSFQIQIDLADNIVSALKNVNGILYVFTGNTSSGTDVSNGYRVSAYTGGISVQEVYYSDQGSPPLHGAVDSAGDRLFWGSFVQHNTTTAGSPNYYAAVMALGSKNASSLPGGVHCVANTTATGAAGDGLVTALKQLEQGSLSFPKLVIGHRDAGGAAIDRQATTYGTCVWRSQLFNINKESIIKRISLSLGTAVAANMTITPTIYYDDFSASSTSNLTVINNTNYANNERKIDYYPDISVKNNFVLELKWTGTALLPILLPIEIEIEEIDSIR